jgi:hypothetical protein
MMNWDEFFMREAMRNLRNASAKYRSVPLSFVTTRSSVAVSTRRSAIPIRPRMRKSRRFALLQEQPTTIGYLVQPCT